MPIYYGNSKIKQVINSDLIKYYKYVYGSWGMPILGENGTVGGGNYAARASGQYDNSSVAFKAFDNNPTTHWEAAAYSLNEWVEFYSPVLLRLSSVDFRNRDSYYKSYTVWRLWCSNDGVNYTAIKDFPLGNNSAGAAWSHVFNLNANYKFFRFTCGAGGDVSTSSEGRVSFAEIKLNAQQVIRIDEVSKNDNYDYRELNQIAEVYNGSSLVFLVGGKIDYTIDNPGSSTVHDFDIHAPGVYKLWLVSGGNSYRWCYIGCNCAGSGAGFIGKLYFKQKCHLRLTVGGQREDSRLQVAEWGNKAVWYDLVVATSSKDNWSADPRGSVGTITVNRSSTFNTFFDIELEANGNGGSGSNGASVWNGYGSGDKNGYGRLQFVRRNQ